MSSIEATLLAYIISQIKANVGFLVDQNHLRSTDADDFIAKLPSSSRRNSIGTPIRPPLPPRPTLEQPLKVQARAMWAYNENNEGDDLSFAAGDIITITEENNADWWTGILNGRSGLFPSNYVEKLSSPPTPRRPGLFPSVHVEKLTPPPTPVSQAPFVTNSTTSGSKTPYRPFSATSHGRDLPPTPGQGVNSVGLQEKDDTKEKNKIYKKLMWSIVSNAAGSVGAAIGGGLVEGI